MNRFPTIAMALAMVLVTVGAGGCQSEMTPVLARDVEILRIFEAQGVIPPERMRDARAVAVIDQFEAAAVIGGSGGQGVMVKRLDDGWSPPLALTVVSGSFGAQIGGQGQQAVLLFKSDRAVNSFVEEGAYSMARAEGTGGSANASAVSTNAGEDVEAFVRSAGLFGSASIGGIGFSVDRDLNRRTYGLDGQTAWILDGTATAPPGALTLWRTLDGMSAPAAAP